MIGPATVALVVDGLFGEPPPAVHPTVGMGRWLSSRRGMRRAASDVGALFEGAAVVGAGAVVAAAIADVLDRLVSAVHPLVRGVALKPALSLRPLLAAARRVQRALERDDLPLARRELARHLVSRDTSTLDAAEVAGAAIESVAENASDSVVAPLLAFHARGLSAAYAYRMVNTADAMLGYHTPELGWFGKAAARADDALNWMPARLTGAMLCLCAFAGGGTSRRAATVMMRDAGRTESPNAGWPMAAMAGALGVHLTKRDHYSLNEHGRPPQAGDVARGSRVVLAVAILTALAVDVL